MGASRVSQEIKTMLIAISATLAALYVHHALERTQAFAGAIVLPRLPDPDFTLPTYDWASTSEPSGHQTNPE